jgi:hypothetical protein
VSTVQYVSLAEPFIPNPPPSEGPETTYGWRPRYLDRYRKQTLPAACIPFQTAPLFVPDVTDPPPPLNWRSGTAYPDRIFRALFPSAAQMATVLDLLRVAPVAIDNGGAIIALDGIQLWQYLAQIGPLDITPPVDPILRWQPKYPASVFRSVFGASQQQAYVADKFTAPAVVTVPDESWNFTSQAIVFGKTSVANRVHAHSFALLELSSALPPPVEEEAWRGVYPNKLALRPFPRAIYTWAQPHFGVTTQVPVMSWTGRYLEPAPRSKPRFHLSPSRFIQPVFIPGVTAVAPDLSWHNEYPAKVYPALRSLAALLGRDVSPLYVADVTVPTPTLSASAIFQDETYAKFGLLTAKQQAFASDARWLAPVPPTVPALAATVYPTIIHGRKQTTVSGRFVAPNYVLDVTLPAPFLSWKADYPDFVPELLKVMEIGSYLLPAYYAPTQSLPFPFKAFWFMSNRILKGGI